MRHFVDLLPEHGWLLVTPVFDAVLAAPGPETVPGTEDTLMQQFEADTGLLMHMSVLATSDSGGVPGPACALQDESGGGGKLLEEAETQMLDEPGVASVPSIPEAPAPDQSLDDSAPKRRRTGKAPAQNGSS